MTRNTTPSGTLNQPAVRLLPDVLLPGFPQGVGQRLGGGDGLSEYDFTSYYAAIAISPDEGLMSEATVAAANYHTVEAASAVALSECNAKKQGAADCVVVALVRPEGWQAQPLQLSSDATAALADYAGGAMAVSAATGSWGLGDTPEAAVAACVDRNAAATDCAAVIAD